MQSQPKLQRTKPTKAANGHHDDEVVEGENSPMQEYNQTEDMDTWYTSLKKQPCGMPKWSYNTKSDGTTPVWNWIGIPKNQGETQMIAEEEENENRNNPSVDPKKHGLETGQVQVEVQNKHPSQAVKQSSRVPRDGVNMLPKAACRKNEAIQGKGIRTNLLPPSHNHPLLN